MTVIKPFDLDYNFPALKQECLQIIEKFGFHPSDNQICLTAYPSDESDHWFGVGSPHPYLDESKKKKDISTFKWVEEKFVHLHDFAMGGEIEKVTSEIRQQVPYGRIRLMRLNRKTCMTLHQDWDERIHIPIQTNKGCYMYFPDYGGFQLEEGVCYWANTKQPHTFFNSGSEDRIHLLFNYDRTASRYNTE